MKLVIPVRHYQSDYAYVPVVVDVKHNYAVEFKSSSVHTYRRIDVCYKRSGQRNCDIMLELDRINAALLYAAFRLVESGATVLASDVRELADVAKIFKVVAEKWLELQPSFQPVTPGRYYLSSNNPVPIYGVGTISEYGEFIEVRDGNELIIYHHDWYPKYIVAGDRLYELKECRLTGGLFDRPLQRLCYGLPKAGVLPPGSEAEIVYNAARVLDTLIS